MVERSVMKKHSSLLGPFVSYKENVLWTWPLIFKPLVKPWVGSAISKGREPRSCLGWVFNFKLGRFTWKHHKCAACKWPLLKLKPRPRFRPVSRSFAMHLGLYKPHLFPTLYLQKWVVFSFAGTVSCPWLGHMDHTKILVRHPWLHLSK